MSKYDFTAHRLFLAAPLNIGAIVPLDRAQSNYLLNVLRLGAGDQVLVFNGVDGEWRAKLALEGRKNAVLAPQEQTRPQPRPADLHYVFAPLKHARLDYMAQKAVEMGASQLTPILTQRTQTTRINLERMRANVIEAAEQCGVLSLPQVIDETPFRKWIETWDPSRTLIFCDEEAPIADPIAALRAAGRPDRLAVLIGPEGGFDDKERAALRALPNVVRLSLGPRILRADTAAVAALALVQAVLGDFGAEPGIF